jgi:aminoglycoside phosphotransferase family enzyme
MLIQFSSNEETRTYIDCQNPYEAMETFCRIYENFLLNKQGILNDRTDKADPVDPPAEQTSIEYKLDDILKFIDQLYDLSALTYNNKAFGFTAHGKAWFKGKIHAYLRKLAAK